MLRSRFRLVAVVLLVPLLVVLGSAWLMVREDGNRIRTRAAATLNSLLQDMSGRYDQVQKDWIRRLPTLLRHSPRLRRRIAPTPGRQPPTCLHRLARGTGRR